MTAFAQQLLKTAIAEIGVRELPKGSNRGPRVDEYQQATWLKKSDWGAWCAAFICWVFMTTMKSLNMDDTPTFKRPLTAGAFDFERWSREQGNETQTIRAPGRNILAGDIVIYRHSHIGIARTSCRDSGFFVAVEGNTNDEGSREGYEVCERNRHFREVKTVIRLREFPTRRGNA